MTTTTLTGSPAREGDVPPPARARSSLDAALAEWDALDFAPRDLLIGGAWRASASGRRLAVEDPATGETICEVADAEPSDARAALDAACDAAESWSHAAPAQRAAVLRRAAERLRTEAERVALLLALDCGKPLAEGREEVAYAAEYLDWYAEEAVRVGGRAQSTPDGECLMLVRRRPVGPCLVITPWNFPLAIPARAVAPALAAGCTVVLRASDRAPLGGLVLARLLIEAGLPSGVLNLIVSSRPDLTDGLLGDPRLRKLTFTGSTTLGRQLGAQAGRALLRMGAELGGQAPFLVFPDADLDQAVAAAIMSKSRNAGQACTAANRFLVHEAVAPEFTRRLVEGLGRLQLGRGDAPGVEMGPVISDAQRERLAELVEDAVSRGAKLALRGGPLPGPGHFFAPVVLTNVPEGARILDQEIFGPVAVVETFRDEAEAVRRANSSEHGLAAYLWTRDLGRGMRLAGSLDCGMVGINRAKLGCAAAPFGGLKASGHGRAGGPEGIDEYLVTSYTAVAGLD
jgi:succinate-semialdehyde dehydrogenase / glutarate-semialdehyde dehydrogenase